MTRPSQYTLLIICEGKNTEPFFFASIRDRIMDGLYPVEAMAITIRPEPRNDVDVDNIDNTSPHRPTRKTRRLLPPRAPIEDEIPGVPPLKGVLAAQKELRDGTFNEVWVVFDDDHHPAKAEAFSKADEMIDGKRVNIAYSSISFEYYLLLHFERIYKTFEKSECRENNRTLICSSGQHPNDCQGEKCVGGYARKRGYWQDSKSTRSLFPLIEDKLKIGFWNSAWLRYTSQMHSNNTALYKRNPFVTTDSVVKRLTGHEKKIFEVVPLERALRIQNKLCIIFQSDLTIRFINISDITIIIPAGSILKKSLTNQVEETVGIRKFIPSGEEETILFASTPQDLQQYEYYFSYEQFHVMLVP